LKLMVVTKVELFLDFSEMMFQRLWYVWNCTRKDGRCCRFGYLLRIHRFREPRLFTGSAAKLKFGNFQSVGSPEPVCEFLPDGRFRSTFVMNVHLGDGVLFHG
jgi:hypothetical protein